VAIVGCGAGGAMVAIEIGRRGLTAPTDLVIVEPRVELGRGLAYSTADPLHLLNVPADSMSAIESEPRHLLDWARRRGISLAADDFLSRRQYGTYLEETLSAHLRRHEARATVRLVRDRTATVRIGPHGRPRLSCTGGTELEADHVVLALGHGPVREPVPVAEEVHRSGRYVARPWNRKPQELAGDGERVLLIGSGLTMVDAALSIAAATSGVRMIAISRSGLLPRAHPPRRSSYDAPFPVPADPRIAAVLAEFLAALTRASGSGGDAADVVDSMRPVTTRIWRGLPTSDRAWFLANLRRIWEVHRHRMAPRVAARIEELRAGGALVTRQASLERLELDGSRIRVHTASAGEARSIAVDRVVNCAGPTDDLSGGEAAPFGQMLAEGIALPDRLGLGLEMTLEGAVVGSDGPHQRLHAIGPVRKGSLWESTAVPELRRQASELAELIVGGKVPAGVAAAA
jgi:uncharacterized NAD(P)/FAD-binding protein YdhS